jgi:ribonuclease BN (tRNA processing enzyme)
MGMPIYLVRLPVFLALLFSSAGSYTLHTPPHTIGKLAKEAGVRRLLLSHLSPATEEMHDTVLKSIHENYTGPVSLAEDGMHVQP